MKTYLIPQGSPVWRGVTYPIGHADEGMLWGAWDSLHSDREVIYTNKDLRWEHKSTLPEYYEFNLPERAMPYTVLAVLTRVVEVTLKTED